MIGSFSTIIFTLADLAAESKDLSIIDVEAAIATVEAIAMMPRASGHQRCRFKRSFYWASWSTASWRVPVYRPAERGRGGSTEERGQSQSHSCSESLIPTYHTQDVSAQRQRSYAQQVRHCVHLNLPVLSGDCHGIKLQYIFR